MKFLILTITLLLSSNFVHAVDPGEILKDSSLEIRARAISKDLRCVVCQNQSIDDSDAELARDLRILVRDRILEGDSDQAVIDYVVSRYGDFVLLNPPVKGVTFVLWFGPIVITLIGFICLILFFRRQKPLVQDLKKNNAEVKK
jgi:cytochrome c-type biogenesis protein CcmH